MYASSIEIMVADEVEGNSQRSSFDAVGKVEERKRKSKKKAAKKKGMSYQLTPNKVLLQSISQDSEVNLAPCGASL